MPDATENKPKTKAWIWFPVVLFPLSVAMNIYLLKSNGIQIQHTHTTSLDSMYLYRHLYDSLRIQNAQLRRQWLNPPGVFLEVQIGSFENFNLEAHQEELGELRMEKHDEKEKFILGRFTDLNRALRFENDMKRIGVKGAFIVGRIDGKLVKKEEAIEALKQMKTK